MQHVADFRNEINHISRTLTPLILVRIQVPQPIDFVDISANYVWTRAHQLGAQLGGFVAKLFFATAASSLVIALSASAGSRCR
jgi:hypothetical protein